MSFDKYYPNRKDRRRPYRGAARFDRGCRTHGSCTYCQRNRLIRSRRAEEAGLDDLHAYLAGESADCSAWHPSNRR